MPTILPPYPAPWDPSGVTVPRKENPTPNEPRYYYFAYGSNLWLSQMNYRCPNYTYVGIGVLRGYRWVISTRGYANVVPSQSPPPPEGEDGKQEKGKDDGGGHDDTGDTYGVVYTLTKSDMDILDVYEGTETKPVPSYYKVTMDIEMTGSKYKEIFEEKARGNKDWVLPCLVYVDPRTAEGKVLKEYIGRINRGLKDANLPKKWVKKVIRKWIPAGVGVVDEESESEIEEKDIGERKGVGKGKVEGQFVHWEPTRV